MRNIKLTIEYDGSRYQGWTRLGKDESGNTISNKITEVLKKMTEEDDLELFCGCRTEVGVHAYAQIANFRTSCSISTQNIKHYLNRYLPMDIAIIEVEEVPERFHAQLNATSKTYVYRMTIDDVPSVFDRKIYLPLLPYPGQTHDAAGCRETHRTSRFPQFLQCEEDEIYSPRDL